MAPSADYVNFRTCCRLCIAEDTSMQNIFSDKYPSSDLAEKIYSVIGIKVTSQDRISVNLCEKCLLYVDNYHKFKSICLINQVKLTKLLSVFEIQLTNESIIIKEEPVSDDDVVYVPDNQLTVKIESHESADYEDDELPPILSPNMPTAEMRRDLEVQQNDQMEEVLEIIEMVESVVEELPPTLIENESHNETQEEQEEPHQEIIFRIPDPPNPPEMQTVPNTETTQNKTTANDSRDIIDFAATLNLAKKMDDINMEPFTNTEVQYAMRMRIIYTQLTTLHCACHNIKKATPKSLNSHLSSHSGVRLPVYTCTACCSTWGRSGYCKHRFNYCNLPPYNNMYDVSNITERGINKHRNYQCFKCKICEATARVLDQYVRHVEDHIHLNPEMFTCHCNKTFNNAKTFKQHMLSSCVMKPSCDMCDIMFDTVDEFKKHCIDEHDDKEGEIFDLDPAFVIEELPFVALYVCVECNLKCKQELFLVKHLQIAHGYDLEAAKRVGVDCYVGPQNGVAEDVGLAQVESQMNQDSFNESSELEKLNDSIPTPGNKVRETVTTKNADEAFMVAAYRKLNMNSIECQICFKTFSNVANVRKHLRQQHLFTNKPRSSSFNCGNCDSTFLSMQLLQTHIMSEHFHTCKECGKKCKNVDELDKHRSSHLKISLTRDPKTLNYRKSGGNDDMPLLQPMDAQDLKVLNQECIHCHKRFATIRGLNMHVTRQHKEATLHRDDLTNFPQRCLRTGCHVLLNSVADWSLHMQMHAEAEANSSDSNSPADDTDYFTCNRCWKVYPTKPKLKKHMETAHMSKSPSKAKRFFCSICKLACNSHAEWIQHKLTHNAKVASKGKGSLCKYCKVVFTNDEELMEHMRIEHGFGNLKLEKSSTRTFDCHVCGKKLPSIDSLRGHIGWHKRLPRKSSLVPVAGKATALESNDIYDKPAMLKLNTQKMFKNKTFVCITCAELFPSTTSLTEHQTTVHGKLRCPTCWKFFSHANELCDHMKSAHVKTEPKPNMKRQLSPQKNEPKRFKRGYEYCKICGTEFGGEEELRDHMQESHPAVPYIPKGSSICPICGTEFRNNAALSSHVRMHVRRGESEQAKKPNKRTDSDKSQAHVNKYTCEICKMSYYLRAALRNHILQEHPF